MRTKLNGWPQNFKESELDELFRHGGARKGAGRPAKEPTVVMRIPVSKVDAVLKIISPKGKRQS